jgi:peptidoglycan/LPS O-acetylase OafA/YrhL
LRGIAVLLVIWHHIGIAAGLARIPAPVPLLSDFGFFGLWLFFVLSGFLLFLPYARSLVRGSPWPSVKRFYGRRFRRIFPVYGLALLFIALVVVGTGASRVPSTDLSLGLAALLLTNLHQGAWTLVQRVDAPLWSLGVEWQFYLVLPWIALILRRLRAMQSIVLALCGLVVLDLGVRCVATAGHYLGHWSDPILSPLYGMKGTYLGIFALGMLIALLWTAHVEAAQPGRATVIRPAFILPCVIIAGIVLCFVWAMQASRIPVGVQPDAWMWPPAQGWAWSIAGEWAMGLCAAGCLIVAIAGPVAVQRACAWRPLRYVGLASYSLYVWHEPILQGVMAFVRVREFLPLVGVFAVLLALVGALSYLCIERRFMAPATSQVRQFTVTPQGALHSPMAPQR